MKSLYQRMDYGAKPYLWAYRKYSDSRFEGYYHWHEGFELLLVHRGRGSVIVNQKTYELRPGMLFFFRPFQLHKVYAEVSPDCPYERSILHFVPSFAEPYMSPFASLKDLFMRMEKGLTEEQAAEAGGLMAAAESACRDFERCEEGSSGAESLEQAALLLLRWLTVLQQAGGLAERSDAAGRKRIRHSEAVMDWLEARYGEPFRLEALAEDMHMSKAYLSRLFRQETGSSITGYLTARRIRQACSLLQSSELSVEMIGEKVGLSNVSYFIQLFKRTVGVSPHQYRLKLQSGETVANARRAGPASLRLP